MSNEKHKKYYRTTPEKKSEIAAIYAPIAVMRDKVLQSIYKETGAVAVATSSGWGMPLFVAGLVFPADHPEASNPHYHQKPAMHDGKEVVIVEGKGNRKAGYALQRKCSEYQKRLKDLPVLKDFIIDHMGVRQTGMGESTGRGVAMLSTQAGIAGDVIVLSIPFPGDNKITIPDYLEEISYGTFYDLVENSK